MQSQISLQRWAFYTQKHAATTVLFELPFTQMIWLMAGKQLQNYQSIKGKI